MTPPNMIALTVICVAIAVALIIASLVRLIEIIMSKK